MACILVTGGAGFIGSTFVRYWLTRHPSDVVINYDKLTYAANPESLRDVVETHRDRYVFIKGDIGNYDLARHVFEHHEP